MPKRKRNNDKEMTKDAVLDDVVKFKARFKGEFKGEVSKNNDRKKFVSKNNQQKKKRHSSTTTTSGMSLTPLSFQSLSCREHVLVRSFVKATTEDVTVGEVVLAYYNKSGWRAAVIETNLKFNNRSRKNECKVRFLGDGSIVYTKSLDQLFVVQKNIKKNNNVDDDVVEVEEEVEEVEEEEEEEEKEEKEEKEEMNQDQEIVAISRKHTSDYYSNTMITNKEAAIALLNLATIEAKRPVTTTSSPLKKNFSKLKKRKLQPCYRAIGFNGVTKRGENNFHASIENDSGTFTYIGTFMIARDAAMAYDKALAENNKSREFMNFPNGSMPIEDQLPGEIAR